MLTQETPRLPLLDYRKPPPGWSLVVAKGFEDGTFFTSAQDSLAGRSDVVAAAYRGETAAEVIAAAWTHYKGHNDPPGMDIWPTTAGPWWGWAFGQTPTRSGHSTGGRQEARAAAWAWYDRRLALVLELAEQMAGFWGPEESAELLPKALVWTDADCAEMDIFLHSPCPEGVNPYREGPACLMLAVWGPSWKPPAVNRFAPVAPPAPVVDQNQTDLFDARIKENRAAIKPGTQAAVQAGYDHSLTSREGPC